MYRYYNDTYYQIKTFLKINIKIQGVIMIRFRQYIFIKIVSMLVIISFLAFDIAWAYPPESGSNFKLAVPMMNASLSMNAQLESLKNVRLNEAGLLGSVLHISDYMFSSTSKKAGEQLREHMQSVIEVEISSALKGIELSAIRFKGKDKKILLVPYDKNNDGEFDFVIQIAQKNSISQKELLGFDWVISDKYAVKVLPRYSYAASYITEIVGKEPGVDSYVSEKDERIPVLATVHEVKVTGDKQKIEKVQIQVINKEKVEELEIGKYKNWHSLPSVDIVFFDWVKTLMPVEGEIRDDAVEFIKYLKSKNKLIHIVSTYGLDSIRGDLEKRGISKYIDSINGSSEEKNKTAVMNTILKKENISASRALMFGDQGTDMEDAKAAKVLGIGIIGDNEAFHIELLEMLGAAFTVREIKYTDELAEKIEKTLKGEPEKDPELIKSEIQQSKEHPLKVISVMRARNVFGSLAFILPFMFFASVMGVRVLKILFPEIQYLVISASAGIVSAVILILGSGNAHQLHERIEDLMSRYFYYELEKIDTDDFNEIIEQSAAILRNNFPDSFNSKKALSEEKKFRRKIKTINKKYNNKDKLVLKSIIQEYLANNIPVAASSGYRHPVFFSLDDDPENVRFKKEIRLHESMSSCAFGMLTLLPGIGAFVRHSYLWGRAIDQEKKFVNQRVQHFQGSNPKKTHRTMLGLLTVFSALFLSHIFYLLFFNEYNLNFSLVVTIIPLLSIANIYDKKLRQRNKDAEAVAAREWFDYGSTREGLGINKLLWSHIAYQYYIKFKEALEKVIEDKEDYRALTEVFKEFSSIREKSTEEENAIIAICKISREYVIWTDNLSEVINSSKNKLNDDQKQRLEKLFELAKKSVKAEKEEQWAVIIAGGEGTRLWPLSYPGSPKQLLEFEKGEGSLLQLAIKRQINPDDPNSLDPSHVIVITSKEIKDKVWEQVEELNMGVPKENIIGEPITLGTGPALRTGAFFIESKIGSEKAENAIIRSLYADHIILNPIAFNKSLAMCADFAKLTNVHMEIGVVPEKDENGEYVINPELGHLVLDQNIGDDLFSLVKRVEKEYKDTSEKTYSYYKDLVKAGAKWNSGCSVIRIGVLKEMMREINPFCEKMFEKHQTNDKKKNIISKMYHEFLRKRNSRKGPAKGKVKISHDTWLVKPLTDKKYAQFDTAACVVDKDENWFDVGNFEEMRRVNGIPNSDNYIAIGSDQSVHFGQETNGNTIFSTDKKTEIFLHDDVMNIIIVHNDKNNSLLVLPRESYVRAAEVYKDIVGNQKKYGRFLSWIKGKGTRQSSQVGDINKDDKQNYIAGNATYLKDCEDCCIFTDDGFVSAIGIKGYTIIWSAEENRIDVYADTDRAMIDEHYRRLSSGKRYSDDMRMPVKKVGVRPDGQLISQNDLAGKKNSKTGMDYEEFDKYGSYLSLFEIVFFDWCGTLSIKGKMSEETIEYLRYLKSKNKKIHIISTYNISSIREKLKKERIVELIDSINGDSPKESETSTGWGKKIGKKDIISKILVNENILSSRAVMYGDTIEDVLAAKAVEIICVGVAESTTDKEDLLVLGAIDTVDRIANNERSAKKIEAVLRALEESRIKKLVQKNLEEKYASYPSIDPLETVFFGWKGTLFCDNEVSEDVVDLLKYLKAKGKSVHIISRVDPYNIFDILNEKKMNGLVDSINGFTRADFKDKDGLPIFMDDRLRSEIIYDILKKNETSVKKALIISGNDANIWAGANEDVSIEESIPGIGVLSGKQSETYLKEKAFAAHIIKKVKYSDDLIFKIDQLLKRKASPAHSFEAISGVLAGGTTFYLAFIAILQAFRIFDQVTWASICIGGVGLYFLWASFRFFIIGVSMFLALSDYYLDNPDYKKYPGTGRPNNIELLNLSVARFDGFRYKAFKYFSSEDKKLIDIHEAYSNHYMALLAMFPLVSLFQNNRINISRKKAAVYSGTISDDSKQPPRSISRNVKMLRVDREYMDPIFGKLNLIPSFTIDTREARRIRRNGPVPRPLNLEVPHIYPGIIDELKRNDLLELSTTLHLMYVRPENDSPRFLLNLCDPRTEEILNHSIIFNTLKKLDNKNPVSLHLGFAMEEYEEEGGSIAIRPIEDREEVKKRIIDNVDLLKRRMKEEGLRNEILLENCDYFPGNNFIWQPDFIKEVIEATGSGLLIDLAHIAATAVVPKKYSQDGKGDRMLPLEYLKKIVNEDNIHLLGEIHVTSVVYHEEKELVHANDHGAQEVHLFEKNKPELRITKELLFYLLDLRKKMRIKSELIINIEALDDSFAKEEVSALAEMLEEFDQMGKDKDNTHDMRDDEILDQANAKETMRLFELVENTINNRRSETVVSVNAISEYLEENGYSEIAPQLFTNPVLRQKATEEMVLRVLGILKLIDENDIQLPENLRAAKEIIEKDITQLRADSIVVSIIVMARRAKRVGQKLIIGIDTSWIPGYKKGNPQHNAMFPLINAIDSLDEALSSMGLNNVIMVKSNGRNFVQELIVTAKENNTDHSNIVVLSSKERIESDLFSVLRDGKDGKRAFLAGICMDEIQAAIEKREQEAVLSGELSDEIYGLSFEIDFLKYFAITLELAMGKTSIVLPDAVYDKKERKVIFFPKIEPVEYGDLVEKYKGETRALASSA